MSESWAEIKDVYNINKPSKKNKLETLDAISNRPENDIISDTKNVIGDIMKDATIASEQSDSFLEWLEKMWTVISSGNRGILIGTILIIVSLLMLATMPNTAA